MACDNLSLSLSLSLSLIHRVSLTHCPPLFLTLSLSLTLLSLALSLTHSLSSSSLSDTLSLTHCPLSFSLSLALFLSLSLSLSLTLSLSLSLSLSLLHKTSFCSLAQISHHNLQDRIANVPVVVTHVVSGGVAVDDRCSGHSKGVPHCLGTHVTEVDHHANAVHLFDHHLLRRTDIVDKDYCYSPSLLITSLSSS